MKFIKRLIIAVILVALAAAGLLIKIGYDKYVEITEEKPLAQVVEQLRKKENYTKIADVREIYLNAVVAVEDKRFYEHGGIDIMGTARAMWRNIEAKKFEQGGSSITQQLAKNMYFPEMEHTLERKAAELFIAMDIEENYEKNEILELYLNGIYYGSGYYSIYDASMGYFGKTPGELTDFECTLLAGIPNAPSVYSLDVNPELAYERQQKVLECMVECGYIEDENDILNE